MHPAYPPRIPPRWVGGGQAGLWEQTLTPFPSPLGTPSPTPTRKPTPSDSLKSGSWHAEGRCRNGLFSRNAAKNTSNGSFEFNLELVSAHGGSSNLAPACGGYVAPLAASTCDPTAFGVVSSLDCGFGDLFKSNCFQDILQKQLKTILYCGFVCVLSYSISCLSLEDLVRKWHAIMNQL